MDQNQLLIIIVIIVIILIIIWFVFLNNSDKRCDFSACCLDCESCIPSKIQDGVDLLFRQFRKVDDGFNDPNKLGLTPEEVGALRYFGPQSNTIAHGPFTPDQCGHSNHTNQPGTFHAIGVEESSFLQVNFEGGLLNDPRFPFKDPKDAPKLYHKPPTITGYLGNGLFNLTAIAEVCFDPNGEGNCNRVALVSSNAVYKYRCDSNGKTDVPVVVWIDFFIRYEDC